MKNKTKNIPGLIFTAISILVITAIAIFNLASAPQLEAIYSKIGLLPYMKILGAALLVFLLLFIYKASMKIGFLLLTAYFGGAMAVELSHGTVFITPAVILAIVWITAYLRDASIFKNSGKNILLTAS